MGIRSARHRREAGRRRHLFRRRRGARTYRHRPRCRRRVHARSTHYAVFAASATDPPKERYLDQVRIISKSALGHFFVCDEAAALPDQTVPVGDFIASFIAAQRAKWSGSGIFPAELAGTLGGDGDWAKESLAFGFLVENTYWAVYRLWSRPWIATK